MKIILGLGLPGRVTGLDVHGAIRNLTRNRDVCAASPGLLVALARLCCASPALSGLLREPLVPGCLWVPLASSGELVLSRGAGLQGELPVTPSFPATGPVWGRLEGGQGPSLCSSSAGGASGALLCGKCGCFGMWYLSTRDKPPMVYSTVQNGHLDLYPCQRFVVGRGKISLCLWHMLSKK